MNLEIELEQEVYSGNLLLQVQMTFSGSDYILSDFRLQSIASML